MRMGENKADEAGAIVRNESQVGQDNVDSRLGLFAELDAEIHQKPLTVARRSETIGVAVHPDLAHAAQRHQHEFGSGVGGSWGTHGGLSETSARLTSPA